MAEDRRADASKFWHLGASKGRSYGPKRLANASEHDDLLQFER
jgi:hypothetical protein